MILNNKLGGDLLSHAKSILSLALVRFTALFEMGRGGSKPLWPPSITGNVVLESLRCFATTLACNKLEEVKINGVLVDCVILNNSSFKTNVNL
jgi:hypothetical protein